MSQQAIIIGGGLIGRLVALKLATAQWQVSLYDKASPAGEQAAAYAAAAMLAPMAESAVATPLVTKLAQESLSLWQTLVPQLVKPVFFQHKGSLIVWHSQDKALAQRFQNALLAANQQQRWLDWQTDTIARNEPQLATRFGQGMYLPTEGQLDNRQTLVALAETLEAKGVNCQWNTECQPEDFVAATHWVLDCRGFGAKTSWNKAVSCQAAAASSLRGIRGEVMRVSSPEIKLNRPVRLLHPRYPLYIAPKENNLFVIGATQIETEDDSNMSVRSSLELASALYAIHPAFGEARILEYASQLRPTLSHEDPEIRYNKQRKIVQINGLYRHGFMLAPSVCESAVSLLSKLTTASEVANQDPIRAISWNAFN